MSLSLTLLAVALLGVVWPASAQRVHGRWDLTATDGRATWPMWLEVVEGPPPAGRLQGRTGHALPLTDLMVSGERLTFSMPSTAAGAEAPRFTATVTGDRLTGEIVRSDGGHIRVTGVRAPALLRDRAPVWGEPVDLLADGLAVWRLRSPGGPDGWSVANGELVNTPPSSDLVSRATFLDFRFEAEVNVPPGGNSGIYLRGRYEVQVHDDHGQEPHSRRMGGIYGQVTPTALPARPAGEWQRFVITLVGRRVTVELNGVTIIDGTEIPGITGGALDSDEGAPGPIMLQGDHSGVRYRNLRITPAR
jgi:hypothetical protein